MNVRSITLTAAAALMISTQAGAVSAASAPPPTAQHAAAVSDKSGSAKVFNTFEAMLKKQGQLPKAIAYLNAHLKEVTASNATLMVLHLENAIEKARISLEKRFEQPSVQTSITKAYKMGYTFGDVIKHTKDKKLKLLSKEASDSGLKLETAEGFFFPIVDYQLFLKYRTYVSADIHSYIDIMAVESQQAGVKDGGLLIGYQQLVRRALAQELFLKKYPKSNRAAKVTDLFHNYKNITFYGTNNTMLFDLDTKKMQPNAQKGYQLILQYQDPASSEYLTLLQDFMKVVEDQGYKLTPDIEKFRNDHIPIQ
jgi:hypothetical protein